jgi:adenine phosphoribosyltransferase
MDIKSLIRDIPDFPKKGIIFKDITPLLADAKAFSYVTKQFAEIARKKNITKIVGIESRGFIFGCAIANELGLGFVPIRKKNKLPAETHREEYALEYGTDIIEIHKDALHFTDRVMLVDDLLATGGTASAALKLIKKTGADVYSLAFMIELSFLNGRKNLGNVDTFSLITY